MLVMQSPVRDVLAVHASEANASQAAWRRPLGGHHGLIWSQTDTQSEVICFCAAASVIVPSQICL